MSKKIWLDNPEDRKAYIITGPTSGIGRCTALELAKHGVVVLVGRNRGKLDEIQKAIEHMGQHAESVVCDLSDPASVRRAVWGDYRPESSDSGPGQQRGHHADAPERRTRWAGTCRLRRTISDRSH